MTVVEKFEDLTKYNLTQYLTDFVTFTRVNQKDIYDYYAGLVQQPSQSSFNKLNTLIDESNRVNEIVLLNKDSFKTYDFWDLVEQLDTIAVKLDTVSNYSKWLRSSITKGNFNPGAAIDFILKQNQSLEGLSNDIGAIDPNNDWVDLAVKNDISEDDYTREGGLSFKFTFSNQRTFNVNVVVDNIIGDSIYGKDVNRQILFEDDDLLTLSASDTIKQAAQILVGLVKGDNPEFPNDGIDKSLVMNLNSVSTLFPSVLRQLYLTASKDDTFKSIEISSIKRDQDAVFIEVTFETRLGETLKENLIS